MNLFKGVDDPYEDKQDDQKYTYCEECGQRLMMHLNGCPICYGVEYAKTHIPTVFGPEATKKRNHKLRR